MQDNSQPNQSYVNNYQPPQSPKPPKPISTHNLSDLFPQEDKGKGNNSGANPVVASAPVVPQTTPQPDPVPVASNPFEIKDDLSSQSEAVSLDSSESSAEFQPQARPITPAATFQQSEPAKPVEFPDTGDKPLDPPPISVGKVPVADITESAPKQDGQSLEEQNIFDLLGVSDGTEEEKEAFLDELQEVVWEDFLEKDVDLLLTEEESKTLSAIKAEGDPNSVEIQEKIFDFLADLIPDLEDIMMEKALELKEDMVMERIAGMKEFYAQNQESMAQIQKAEDLISQDQWATAAEVLNGIN